MSELGTFIKYIFHGIALLSLAPVLFFIATLFSIILTMAIATLFLLVMFIVVPSIIGAVNIIINGLLWGKTLLTWSRILLQGFIMAIILFVKKMATTKKSWLNTLFGLNTSPRHSPC